jgi:cell division protein FtsQ
MRKWKVYIITLLLLLAVSFLYAFAQHQNKQEKIDKIEVVFEESQALYITESMVNKLLIQSEQDLFSKSKSDINLYRIEQEIKNNKMLENAEVFYLPSGVLQVSLVQRVPVARVQDPRGSYYIDRQGLAMPLSANFTARVLLLTGVDTNDTVKESFELIEKILADPFYKKQIIGLHRKENGDYLLNVRIGNHKVLLGNLINIDDKLRKLKVFYSHHWKKKSLDEYRLINLKYDRQVVCSI